MAAISQTTATFLVSTVAFPFAAASIWKKEGRDTSISIVGRRNYRNNLDVPT
jgi:hypothetical protein